VTVSYSYDALGRRTQRSSSTSGTTKFIYDGADVVRDLNTDGSTAADYLNGPGIDNKLRQTAGGTTSYFVTNHLGTTRALTDPSGNVTSSLTYDSFGNVTSGSASTRYAYTGREADADTDLMFYRARWYDPQLGRFISEDPIGLGGGGNLYAYVENDPLDAVDPEGLVPKDKWYGYNNKDFRRWFHRCHEQGGEGRQNATKDEMEIAHREWVSRGSPRGGKCWGRGGGPPVPVECPDPKTSRSRKRWPGPLLDELRMEEESYRQMERFWTKVLVGDLVVGGVFLAPEGTAAAIVRGLGSAAKALTGSGRPLVPVPVH